MRKPKLIARQRECAQLDRCMQSPQSEFVIVCGRRRIGKTFLIEQYFKKKYDFSFVGGHRVETRIQLRNFAKALKSYSGEKSYKFADWFDAFDALEEYLDRLPKDRKKVIFIDEMPWIDTLRSDFVSALENFWNGWANRRYDIVLVASGSATSWMADKIAANQGGLHNRITASLRLQPFSLKETEEYLTHLGFRWDRYQILQCYMFTGGVPYYLSLLQPQLSAAQNIDALCFGTDAPLRNEFDELYNALFNNAEAYIEIVRILNEHKKGLTKREIAVLASSNGTLLKKTLKNLELCDFITAMAQFGKKREIIYRLTDHYTLFYYKFIAGNLEWAPQWWAHHLGSGTVQAWQGLTYEIICLRHHNQIKKALGISGIATAVSTWHCPPDKENGLQGAQIDMVIDRSDRIIHLCEVKFSVKEYDISADYEEALRKRLSLFAHKTKTRKAVVNTFITIYGIGVGKHHSVVHSELTMNQLFSE